MLKYGYVINDLGSGGKVWPFDWVCPLVGPDRKDKGARGAYFEKPVDLDGRRTVSESLFKERQKAGAETHEKKCLINCRTTDKILLPTKGVVL